MKRDTDPLMKKIPKRLKFYLILKFLSVIAYVFIFLKNSIPISFIHIYLPFEFFFPSQNYHLASFVLIICVSLALAQHLACCLWPSHKFNNAEQKLYHQLWLAITFIRMITNSTPYIIHYSYLIHYNTFSE